MIRTHRPRGYQWTTASEFQQTELFRNIRYEDAECVDDEVLNSDSEDEFPLSDRILKRQRVEKLADGLLNGEELHIHSARIDAHHVLQSLSCCFHKPKCLAQAIAEADWDEGSDDEWHDAEDDWAFLERQRPRPRSAADLPGEDVSASSEEEVSIEVQQSSCQRRRSQRIAKLIAIAPSEDALRKAATLRNRKYDIAEPAAVEESIPQPCPESVIADSQLDCSPDEELVSECGPSPTPAWTSAMWRSKGGFRPARKPRPVLKPVDQDCSRDELALSSFGAPSHPVGNTKPLGRATEHDAVAQDSQNAAVVALLSSFSGSVDQCSNDQQMVRETRSAGGTPVTASLQPKQDVNRRRSAPSQSQKIAQAHGDSTAGQRQKVRGGAAQYNESVGVKGCSPFLFRKRALRSNNGYQSPLDVSALKDMLAPVPAPAKTPSKLVHFESSLLPPSPQASRTPLMDEHVNHRLPQEISSSRRSISLRSSLRQEMIASGAEISRIEADESSQPAESTSQEGKQEHLELSVVEDSFARLEELGNDSSTVAKSVDQQPELQQLWPGTQAMLAQAQHELFTSPEKTDSSLYLGDATTPQAQSNTGVRRRRPLGALSQEPMPSTQALLQDWQGWSSIKKPRQPGTTGDSFQSPTVLKSTHSKSATGHVRSFEDKAKRRSSLRFAMSLSQDSPESAITPTKPSSVPAQSTDMEPATAEQAAPTTWPRPSGKIASSASFSVGISSLAVASCRSQPSLNSDRNEHDPFKDTTVLADSTTVSLSFGAPQKSSAHSIRIKSASQPAPDLEPIVQSYAEDKSAWRSPGAVKMSEPTAQNEETVISELSFGPPNVQLDSFGEPLPSYLGVQHAQQMSDCDSQELRSTMNSIVENVLGPAASFSF
ncbi:hypothetical protein CKM354_000500000 [Cercospora kikuchii]|uniref:Uncharacterized protein n=1 Tax=Cercospora kikuchii TaxID=84275 RepID=A0A9P3CF04_9PEZI|nr:uncharacterized protein CKM354_000500000 [Cercospora kikuchii]GIZ41704.1 hypothetical protein CKM354_000500000 [Cercospora kikuchii]